jgi:hypothetical protein
MTNNYIQVHVLRAAEVAGKAGISPPRYPGASRLTEKTMHVFGGHFLVWKYLLQLAVYASRSGTNQLYVYTFRHYITFAS